jgi:hypothetical protein
MPRKSERAEKREKHVVSWEQLCAFAKTIDREITHVYRVFRGDRSSPPIADAFQAHFGFAIKDATLAGRKPIRSVA